MKTFVYHAASEADTERLGAALADALPDGGLVALNGTLGSGKTRLVKAVGAFTELAVGMATAVAGDLDFNVPGLRVVHGCIAAPQGASAAGESFIVTATSGNNVVAEMIDESGDVSGGSVIMFIAWGIPQL